jgi:sortase A
MRKRHRIMATFSLTFLATGLVTAGYSGYRIWSDNRVDGIPYIPAVDQKLSGKMLALTPHIVPPKEGDYLGTISIPSLGKTIKIYQGTTDSTLSKGIGHFTQSVMPGVVNNTVLAGHRDTVFSHLYRVQIGEDITIVDAQGTFTYQVIGTRIVKANDKTVIVPTATAVLTISTCYPFTWIGSAPDRFIVSAELIPPLILI